MVYMSEVPRIERAWRERGEPHCAHGRVGRERHDLGADTGDWVCLDCGLDWSRTGPTPAPRGNHDR